MKKKRTLTPRRRRARENEDLEGGQDSFLDVTSNLVGVLIILIMIAGVRVRRATTALEASAVAVAIAEDSEYDAEERARRAFYAETVAKVEALSEQVRATQESTREFDERAAMVQNQADAAEREYQALFEARAAVDAILENESQKKSETEKRVFDLKSEILAKEQKRDAMRREKEALEASRPNAIALQNVPTPLAKRVDDCVEGHFRLKGGKISHVPVSALEERLKLFVKNYRGDLTPRIMEDRIGPYEDYYFQYRLKLDSHRTAEGVGYSLEFLYGEFQPTRDDLGETVDDALANPKSVFRERLLRYSRDESVITLHVYPDSYACLNDLKKALFSLGYQIAMRPTPADAPIAMSPDGTPSAAY